MSTEIPVPPPTLALDPEPALRDNRARDRFELWSGDELIGLEGYRRHDDGTIVLLHTVATDAYERKGFARFLVHSVLDEVAAEGLKIVPVCTYVQSFLTRFPQYQALVADDPDDPDDPDNPGS